MENAVDTFILGDVLVHTWDLARAAGLDEGLDADEVHRMVDSMEPYDEALRQSGHYGARVQVGGRRRRADPASRLHGRQP